MLQTILHFLHSIPPAAVVGLVFLIPATESALVLGLLLPGELAVVTGGVLAARSHVPLGPIIAAAVAGAILGDTLGYLVGRRYRKLIARRLPTKRWKKAEGWLRDRGPFAVFLARFTAFIRTLMPPVAGAAKLAYPVFLRWSVAAGILWGIGSVLLGYFAARNVEKILRWSSAGLAVLAIGAGVGIYFATRHRGRRRRRATAQ
jgi:membrane-associated protein